MESIKTRYILADIADRIIEGAIAFARDIVSGKKSIRRIGLVAEFKVPTPPA